MSVVPGSYRERLDGELDASVGFLQHLVISAANCRFLARSTSMVNLRIWWWGGVDEKSAGWHGLLERFTAAVPSTQYLISTISASCVIMPLHFYQTQGSSPELFSTYSQKGGHKHTISLIFS